MFVGRSAELAQVDALLAEASAGYGGVLWLTGEPGVGKSGLLAAAARRARRQGLQTATVRAVPLAEPIGYALVDDLLRTVGGPPAEVIGPTTVASAVSGLVHALAEWAGRSPSLITIDDLASADEASITVVVAALARTSDLPLAVLVTSRYARTPTGSSAACSGWARLSLGPLDSLAAAAVARAALGSEACERTVNAVAASGHGNPAAIRDMSRLLSREAVSGTVPLPDPLPISPSVWMPWTAALADLPMVTRDALGVLALIGSEHFELLSAVLATASYDVSDLDAATDAGVLRADRQGAPEFVHPLLRSMIIAGMEPATCRALHRAAATAADHLQLPPRLVVRHLTASTPRPDAEVADSLADQAQRARDLRDADGAADAQVWAARLTPDAGLRRPRILRAVEDRAACINSPEAVTELLLLLGPDPVPSELLPWVTQLKTSVEQDLTRAATDHRLAVEEARVHAPELLPELLWDAAYLGWAMGQPEAAMGAADEFVHLVAGGAEVWRELPAWSGSALRAASLFQLGQVAESASVRRDALEAADRLDPSRCDPDMLVWAVELDDLLLADTPGSRSRMSVALRRCVRDSPTTPCLWGIAAWQARARGDWLSAQLLIHDGVALCHEMSAVVPLRGLLALSVELASLQGDGERLEHHGRALQNLGVWTSDRRRLAILNRATGMAELATGSLDAAAASLGEAADVGFLGRGLRDAVIPSRVDLVEVLHRLDRHDEAAERAEALHPILRAVDQPLAQAWDERVSALVSHGGEAEAHYEAALVAHADGSDPFEAGRTELLYGEHLRRCQHRSLARTHLARAVALFTQMRALPWLERAEQELRVSGTPRPREASPSSALTGQEANIASAVAQGRSTREVAELFVLSPRTVETHLSSVYRKLGVTGRSGLAKALVEREG